MIAEVLHKKKVIPVSFPLTSLEEGKYTILHCETFQRTERLPHGFLTVRWTTVTKSASIINRDTKEQLQLLHAINIPVNPEKYWFKRFGERLAFTLIYPAIPSDWVSFDFSGDPGSVTDIPEGHELTGWLVRNIKRNDIGVYHIKL